MIEDMGVRRFRRDTNATTSAHVKKLAAVLGRSPDTATAEDLRALPGAPDASAACNRRRMNSTVSALRFFFRITLDRPEMTRHLGSLHEPRKLPRVLSPEEVGCAAGSGRRSPKYKAALERRLWRGLARAWRS